MIILNNLRAGCIAVYFKATGITRYLTVSKPINDELMMSGIDLLNEDLQRHASLSRDTKGKYSIKYEFVLPEKSTKKVKKSR